MYLLKTEHSFDSAHFLSGYEGKCSNIHGHRWKVVAEVKSETLIPEGQVRGMVVDFSDLKRDVKELVDFYDHALIIETGTMKPLLLEMLKEDFRVIEVNFRPTAEEFSRMFFEALKDRGYSVKRVSVYETPKNCATYEE